jgi:hypothetical protein
LLICGRSRCLEKNYWKNFLFDPIEILFGDNITIDALWKEEIKKAENNGPIWTIVIYSCLSNAELNNFSLHCSWHQTAD